jgi:hypothetical protein
MTRFRVARFAGARSILGARTHRKAGGSRTLRETRLALVRGRSPRQDGNREPELGLISNSNRIEIIDPLLGFTSAPPIPGPTSATPFMSWFHEREWHLFCAHEAERPLMEGGTVMSPTLLSAATAPSSARTSSRKDSRSFSRSPSTVKLLPVENRSCTTA